MHDDLRRAIDGAFPSFRARLEGLVRIASVSASGFDPGEVRRSAEAVQGTLAGIGFEEVRLLEVAGAHPAVFGARWVSQSAPTVLLYAHHDVQPPGDLAQWISDPFVPVERDGRLYGRGASDDKAGLIVHVGALEALGAGLPANVKVFVEGEEEIGSAHLPAFLATYAEELAADVIVVTDAGNWRVGQPAFTTTVRGLVDCEVEVRTLKSGVHSGLFGGVLPDALSALSRLLASLHDEQGRAAVAGLVASDADPLDLTEPEIREQAGAVDGVELVGTGSLTARMWTHPAISVLGVDAPSVTGAINQLVPVARAKVSLRVAPGDDPERAFGALRRHLEAHAPWGAQVTVTRGPGSAAPVTLDTSGPAFEAFRTGMREAWGREPVTIGVGGSIPFVGAFAEAFPRAEILLTATGDPTSRIHGPNESQDLNDLRKACLAEAIALRLLGS